MFIAALLNSWNKPNVFELISSRQNETHTNRGTLSGIKKKIKYRLMLHTIGGKLRNIVRS